MISGREIKANARRYGVPETTVERDYVQNWFLNCLAPEMEILAFKGGTAIRKAYLGNYRFSDDLDFTLLRDVRSGELLEILRNARKRTVVLGGIGLEEDIKLKEVLNGWRAVLQFRSSLSANIMMNIKIDMTGYGKEIVCLPLERRQLFHEFSDVCGTKVMTYSLNEIMAEKMRALFVRGWPRDCYDVHRLWDLVDLDDVIPVFHKKCEFRNIVPDILEFTGDRELMMGGWDRSLGNQIRDLPDFDTVFDTLLHRFQTRGIG